MKRFLQHVKNNRDVADIAPNNNNPIDFIMPRNISHDPTPPNAASCPTQQVPQAPQCGEGCHTCGLQEFEFQAPPIQGWRFALGSLCLFVLPLTFALLGAAIGSGNAMHQVLGGIVGLGLGMGTARGISGLFHHLSKEHTWLQP